MKKPEELVEAIETTKKELEALYKERDETILYAVNKGASVAKISAAYGIVPTNVYRLIKANRNKPSQQ